MKTTTNYQKTRNPEQVKKRSVWNLRISAVSLFLIISFTLAAQSRLTLYTDAGKNNVSGGFFFKSALLGQYESEKQRIETGFEFNLRGNNQPLISGYTISTSRNLFKKSLRMKSRDSAPGLAIPHLSVKQTGELC